jgi:peptidoglycan/LPS O-acetylase OafA/YrhL
MADEPRQQYLGLSLDPKRNSLNFLRLLLAITVLVTHSRSIGGFGGEPAIHGTTFATVAVYGFFGISGYLIAGSAEGRSAGRYLWQRCLRILPGFWVALIITAFGLAWLGWLGAHHHGGYLSIKRHSPFGFVANNWWLDMRQFKIGSTVWNGSLWTLFYEFLCYLILLGLALAGVLGRRTWMLAIAGGLWLSQALITITPGQDTYFNVYHNWQLMALIKFAAVFLVGSAVYLWRDRIPDSGWLALACAVLFTASLTLPGDLPSFYFRPDALGAPLVAYPLLWLGVHLPFDRVGRANDYSYGTYIYAYPVSVLLAIWHANRLGFVPFALLCVIATAPLAVCSWWLIEKKAMSLRRIRWRPEVSEVPEVPEAREVSEVPEAPLLGGPAE